MWRRPGASADIDSPVFSHLIFLTDSGRALPLNTDEVQASHTGCISLTVSFTDFSA
jgi:hypothetical protein